MQQRDRGLTLLELLVVIVVLGVLATVVVVAAGGFQSSARSTVCETEFAQVEAAVDDWADDHPGDPADMDALDVYLAEPSGGWNGTYTLTVGAVTQESCSARSSRG